MGVQRTHGDFKRGFHVLNSRYVRRGLGCGQCLPGLKGAQTNTKRGREGPTPYSEGGTVGKAVRVPSAVAKGPT